MIRFHHTSAAISKLKVHFQSLPSSSFKFAQYLFLILIVSLPLVSPFNFKVRGLVIPIADFIFLLTVGAWVPSLISRSAEIRWNYFYIPLAMYLLALICSVLASANQGFSMLKLVGKAYLISLAILTFNLIKTPEFLERVLRAWLIGTLITVTVSIAGVVLFYAGVTNPTVNTAVHQGYGSLPQGNYPRIEGLFEYPAMLCNYLGVSLMFALALWSPGLFQTSWASLILIISILLTSIFTLSPELGGIMLSLGLWLWVQLRHTGHVLLSRLALTGGMACSLVFFAAAAITLFSYTPNGTDVPLARMEIRPSPRLLNWQDAFETFRQHPVFGRGVGMEVSSLIYTSPSGKTGRITDAHNTYLSVASETGLAGFLSFGALIIFLIRSLSPLRVDGSSQFAIGASMTLAFINAFLYPSLVGSFEDARHLWVFFGILVAWKEISRTRPQSVH